MPQPVERIDEDITKTEEIESHQSQSAPSAQAESAAALLEAVPQETMSKADLSKDTASKNSQIQEPSMVPKELPTISRPSGQEYVSARAFNLGAIPVSAVHDAQVSPVQRPYIPNYHLRPIYVPPLLK